VSQVFSAHVDAMAGKVLVALDGRTKPIVLEVGCGQGYFLERLASLSAHPLGGALGFDPSFRGEAKPPLRIQARYFDRAAAEEIQASIDAIASRHVIEHIIEPVAFLKAVRAALPDDARVELFLETPCVEWILSGSVVQDFFYEHCSYFTAETLGLSLRRAGFGVESVEHVFAGQYLWAKAHPDAAVSTSLPTSLPQLALAERFAARSDAVAKRWRKQIERIAGSGGKVALWGAAAKGVTFASIIDPGRELIDCLVDVNPKKQGNYAPITAHPIVAADQAAARGVTAAVIMNPNYRAEIVAMVRDRGLPFALFYG
jgi:cyclopropane fatty-acyl-phospholipid synthase-like methyltransferase